MNRGVFIGAMVIRSRIACCLIPLTFLALVPHWVHAGDPQQWDPPAIKVFPEHERSAWTQKALDDFIEAGRILFATKFNSVDGAGRPNATGHATPTSRTTASHPQFIRTAGPDANSCAGCHNQPQLGGSGEFVANAFVGAQLTDPPTLSVSTEVTNERNTIGLFGSGAIDMIAREMTRDLQAQRDSGIKLAKLLGRDQQIALQSKGIHFGTIIVKSNGEIESTYLEGVDRDLVVKPFGSKGTSVSLREFTVGALNHHHGIQAVERFGVKKTGQLDFDKDGVDEEFTVGQVSALVMFQASLPPPQRKLAHDSKARAMQLRGETLFAEIGCASCHVPQLFLESTEFVEPSPYNREGTARADEVGTVIRVPLKDRAQGMNSGSPNKRGLYVYAYSDLKRHKICDEKAPFFCNEKVRQDNIATDEFMTPKLWDLATSAPYGHRGDCSTLSEVIMHHGGEGTSSRVRFEKLPEGDKRAVIGFLLSLGASDRI